MIWIVLFLVLLLGIGLYDFFKTKNFADYTVAGRRQNTLMVTVSLLATIIGASSSIGMLGKVYQIGFPYFWWLGVGAIGLFLQSIFVSHRLKQFEAYTLPDVAKKSIGSPSHYIISVIILLSWIYIIAAQFRAASALISILLEADSVSVLVLIITGFAMILYTILGGQLSIFKTDLVQFGILFAGLLYACIHLFFISDVPTPAIQIELFNEHFTPYNLLYLLFIVGGAYFIGPDMFSRMFAAKNERTARRASLITAFALVGMGVLLSTIGSWMHEVMPQGLEKASILPTFFTTYFPKAGIVFIAFGLLSAIISSADTCLVTAAAIFQNDVLKKQSLAGTRIILGIFGGLALMIAVLYPDILTLLLYAYSVYSPGIVMPLFVSILVYNRFPVNTMLMILALTAGGVLGLLGNIFHVSLLALIGMAVSLLLALIAVGWKRPIQSHT